METINTRVDLFLRIYLIAGKKDIKDIMGL
jgi:hypothetical protein